MAAVNGNMAQVNPVLKAWASPSSPTSLDEPFEDVSYPTRSLDFLKQLRKSQVEPIERSEPIHAKFNVIIIGAGLGGLSTAVALAKDGHSVRILEQAPQIGEVGAGIQIPSNSSRILHQWGVDKFFEGRAVEPESIQFRRWEDGQIIAKTRLVPEFRQKYHAPYLVVHRAHFHDALYQRALELGVTVETGCRVTEYHEQEPSVTLQNGKKVRGDIVVAADGIKSIAPQQLGWPPSGTAYHTGFAAYRASVDVAKMKADPDTAWLLEKPNLNIWIGEDRHVMTYTIASGTSFNMVLSHVDCTDPQSWTAETAIEDMRACFQGWDSRLVKVINMIDKTMKWPLMAMTPLQKWVSRSGKMTLLGDAAHAMLPYMSQGAAMAVEDAAAFAAVLSRIRSDDSHHFSLSQAMGIFEAVRTKRGNQMQQASMVNGKLWHLRDGPEQKARDEAMRPEVTGETIESSPNQWSDPVTQAWTYGYDAVEEIEKAIREAVDL